MSQTGALGSLTATYTDSEGEDGAEEDFQDNNDSNTPKRPPQNEIESDKSNSNSPTLNGRNNLPTLVTDVTVKTQRLVSYFDDTMVSDDEGTTTVISTTEVMVSINGNQSASTRNNVQSPEHQRDFMSDGEADSYGVVIPPAPAGSCPIELQEKIARLHRKMESHQLDMNHLIQQRKDFRNPSIYEKLIQFCNINELGTNYQPERFDPFKWSKDSYYEELAKVQKVEMEKLEKQRSDKTKKEKTKIEIVSGTAKRPTTAVASAEDVKKRKSKWDQTTTVIPAVQVQSTKKI